MVCCFVKVLPRNNVYISFINPVDVDWYIEGAALKLLCYTDYGGELLPTVAHLLHVSLYSIDRTP